ncbi:ATP-dependent zinc protease [Marinobacter sp. X15-166B]|uniref:ATP-dependent zinc protease family protein n=1 Tax=Marinobacter sp. X15-166B TaxID=1897620 RepID=UPI00085BF558|nr:RimK/LysX family protein [Marinobacter sp. X15-166B]OEY67007.1 ribosomal protein S6 modification protein [Marinobacter sp. X15-166B]
MPSTHTPYRLLSLALLATTVLFAGCASDQYFMVPKNDLNELHAQLHGQTAELSSLLVTATARHDSLSRQHQAQTEALLLNLSRQVDNFSCPPAPAPLACPQPSPMSQADRAAADRLKGKIIVGEREKILLADTGVVYTARIDSGAETSSLDARNITRFERDGKNWVRFDVPTPSTNKDEAPTFTTLEREIVRNVRIIQSNTDSYERRAVVELQFAIGNYQQKAEFTLSDREHLTFTVLIGRNILRDVALVDVGKEFTTEIPAELLKQMGNRK